MLDLLNPLIWSHVDCLCLVNDFMMEFISISSLIDFFLFYTSLGLNCLMIMRIASITISIV